MKIRNGFVSNSSSSSFCIFGSEYSGVEDQVRAILTERAKDDPDTLSEIENCDEAELVELYIKDTELEVHYGPDGEGYIGREYTSIGLDETGREFQESVNKVLEPLGLSGNTFEEGWYNG